MKHTHKFLPYKELEIPNGKYLVNKNSDLDLEAVSRGYVDESVKIMTDIYLILYCQSCGEIKGKKLQKEVSKNEKNKS